MAQRLLSTLGFLICSAFLTLTVLAQPQDLNALRASYANGKERIDAAAQNQRESALRLYGVEIDSFLEDLKKDGDIATYTVVEKERNRFRAEKTVPITSANSRIGKAITAYQTKMADVAANADSETAQLLTKCITDLADLIKDLMQKNKIEDAKAAGVVRKNLEALLARVEGGRQPPNPVIEPAVKKPETVTAKAADSQKPTKSDAGKEPVVDKVVQSDDLSSSKYTPVSASVDLGNGVTLEMVWCPAGRFIIGAQKGEQGYKENEPQHQVTLSKGFWIGKTEVTQAQWESVMGRNPSYLKGSEKPVESVTWNDCQAFIKKLNEKKPTFKETNALTKVCRFRLPTEAEWEYACRAGSTNRIAGDVDEMAWHAGNSGRKPHPVGQKRPNAWGLHDMYGNVWEWCEDVYGDYPVGSVTDPCANSGQGTEHIFRGFSCCNVASEIRATCRCHVIHEGRDGTVGLRVVMDAAVR